MSKTKVLFLCTGMTCPDCRVEMNHHCDKVVYATDPVRDPHVS
jgi:hypothetical protein